MPLHSKKIASLSGATMASIVFFTFSSVTILQITITLLALCGLELAYFPTVRAFSMKHTCTIYGRRCTSISCLHPLFPLMVSLCISDTSLHSRLKSGLFNSSSSRINLASSHQHAQLLIGLFNFILVHYTNHVIIKIASNIKL